MLVITVFGFHSIHQIVEITSNVCAVHQTKRNRSFPEACVIFETVDEVELAIIIKEWNCTSSNIQSVCVAS